MDIEPRKYTATHPHTLKIVSVGRLDWRKGFEHGMVAAEELMKRGVDFHWQIFGEGEYRLALQWAIRDMGLQERVVLCGPMKHQEILQALIAADVFFHPSIHEGISNAVLEAMAVGLPVVACDVGGMREAIPSEAVGLLFPPRNWYAMANGLEMLANDRELQERIGSTARQFVRSGFTAEKQMAGFLALFHQVSLQEPV